MVPAPFLSGGEPRRLHRRSWHRETGSPAYTTVTNPGASWPRSPARHAAPPPLGPPPCCLGLPRRHLTSLTPRRVPHRRQGHPPPTVPPTTPCRLPSTPPPSTAPSVGPGPRPDAEKTAGVLAVPPRRRGDRTCLARHPGLFSVAERSTTAPVRPRRLGEPLLPGTATDYHPGAVPVSNAAAPEPVGAWFTMHPSAGHWPHQLPPGAPGGARAFRTSIHLGLTLWNRLK